MIGRANVTCWFTYTAAALQAPATVPLYLSIAWRLNRLFEIEVQTCVCWVACFVLSAASLHLQAMKHNVAKRQMQKGDDFALGAVSM